MPAPASLKRQFFSQRKDSSLSLKTGLTNSNNHANSQVPANLEPPTDCGDVGTCCQELSNVDSMLSNVVAELEEMGYSDTQSAGIVDVFVRHGLIRPSKRDLTREVREWVLTTLANELSTSANACQLLTTDIFRELGIKSREDQKKVSVILGRLVKEGLIERWGDRRGQYRIVNREADEIDFLSASGEEYPIVLPLGLHRLAKIMPKNIIIVAGESNAGKSAFLLNIVRDNMHKHPVHYFSSEMGSEEFRERLQLFGDPLEDWKFRAVERAGNFADVIQPDALNIVDFLEVHDEFWKIGGMLKLIFDKLRTGIAIVALQKNRGADLGKGGNASLEKARLYLTLSADPPRGNRISIQKCKNFRDKTRNPNGLSMDFKLVSGANFMPIGDWHHEKPAGAR